MPITNEVLAERIENLSELLKIGFLDNKEEHEKILTTFSKEITSIKKDVRELQDWRITFVAKLGVWSALAVFFGTIVGSLLVNLIGKYI